MYIYRERQISFTDSSCIDAYLTREPQKEKNDLRYKNDLRKKKFAMSSTCNFWAIVVYCFDLHS